MSLGKLLLMFGLNYAVNSSLMLAVLSWIYPAATLHWFVMATFPWVCLGSVIEAVALYVFAVVTTHRVPS